jgi:hypothetical protein
MTDTAPWQAPDLGVPAGPGVTPPFAAPPVEGRSTRLWVGLGIGALALLLCGGGGVAALIGLVLTTSKAADEQVRASVGAYFDAVRAKQYDEAYRLLCPPARAAESASAFATRVAAEDPIRTYDVQPVALASTDLNVDVDVVYDNGTQDTVQVQLRQNTSTGRFEVCGVKE